MRRSARSSTIAAMGLPWALARWRNGSMGRRRCACVLLGAALGGCSFDTSGPGGSPASGVVDESSADGNPTTGPGEDPSNDSSGTPQPSDTSAASFDPSTSTGEVGQGGVVIVGGPLFDFANVELSTPQIREIEIRNQGDEMVMDLAADLEGEWFSFEGGEYPGTTGTCGDVLAPDNRCVVSVVCKATQWGVGHGGITVEHVDAATGPVSVTADFVGNGVGESNNLVINGDGEEQGNPPPGWEESAGTDWRTTTTSPASGVGAIMAGYGGEVELLEARQTIDLESWAEHIDAGALTIRLQANLRSEFTDDDPASVRLLLRDGGGAEIGRIEADWVRQASWVARDSEQVAPEGTRSVVVVLRCSREIGDTCNGMFDDVRVTGRI